jgi:ribonuclease P protein component
MLPQRNRLKKKNEIEQVFRVGKTWHTPFFSLKYLSSDSSKPLLRVAFSLGKKFLSRAVERNRLKRRIVEKIARYTELSTTNLDIVVFLRQKSALPTEKELEKVVAEFFEKMYNGYK